MTPLTHGLRIFLILLLPFHLWSQCDPITSPGEIAGYESKCDPYDPLPITNVTLPTGGSGEIEYVWLVTTNPSVVAGFTPVDLATMMIPNSNSPDFDPVGIISQTTWYRRCSRRLGCSNYSGESYWVKKEVGTCPTQCFEKHLVSNTIDNCSNLGGGSPTKSEYGMYLANNQTLYKLGNDGVFQEFTNGKAKFTASIVTSSGLKIGEIDVQFSDRTSTPPPLSPKTLLNCFAQNTSAWRYYPNINGRVTLNGVVKDIVVDGAAFQVGIGANLQENVLGASAWWKSSGMSGDFNFNLGPDVCTTCQNVTDAGVISGNESFCKPYNPSKILNTTLPNGGAGILHYQWLRTTDLTTSQGLDNKYTIIPVDAAEYDPDEIITQTTWYRRCSRREGCTLFNTGESVWVKKEVTIAPTLTINGETSICKYEVGKITLTASPSPAGNYAYAWSSGQTTASIDVTSSGKYVVTISSLSGSCEVVSSKDVTVNECCNLSSGGTITGNESNCGPYNPNKIMNLTLPDGGAGVLHYQWLRTTDLATSQGLDNKYTIIPVDAAEYDPDEVITQTTWYRRCSRREGCTLYNTGESIWIKKEVTNPPTVTIVGVSSVCKYYAGKIILTAEASPIGNYLYMWSTGEKTATIDAMATGTYSVTVLSSKTCFATASKDVTLTECCNLMMGGTISGNESNCGPYNPNKIMNVVLPDGGAGTIHYQWLRTTDPATAQDLGNKYTIIPVDAAEYDPDEVITETTWYRRCSRREGCTLYNTGESIWIKKEVTLPPTVTILGESNVCKYGAGKITLTAEAKPAGNYLYLWSNGQKTSSIDVTATGNYCVTVLSSKTCFAKATKDVTVNECCNVTDPGSVCCNQTACSFPFDPAIIKESKPASGGEGTLIYLWLISTDGVTYDEIPNSNVKEYDPPIVNKKTWFRRCVARQGCNPYNFESSGDIIIDVAPSTNVSITGLNKFCVYGAGSSTLTANVTGGKSPYTYTWSSGEKTPTILAKKTSTYGVTISTSDGCTAVAGFKVQADSCCNVTNPGEIIGDELSCKTSFDASKILESKPASGGEGDLVYLWLYSTDPTLSVFNEVPNSNVKEYDPLPTTQTTWYRRCVARKGCSPYNFETGNTVKKEIYAAQKVTLVSTDAKCKGDENGSITTTVSGIYPPFTYLWNNGQTVANLINLKAGKYAVTVTDSKSCEVVKDILVNESPTNLVLAKSKIDVKCFGGNDGEATIDISGGKAPYNMQWSNSASTNTIKNLAKGEYKAIVKDANGCQKSIEVNINQPSKVSFQAAVQGESCFGKADGSISLSLNGGTAPYKCAWSNGKNTANISNLAASKHYLTVTDANNCLGTKDFTIEAAKELLTTVSKCDILCSDGTGNCKALPVGGKPPYSCQWSNGNTTPQVFNLKAGTYQVTVCDANKCKKISEATLTVPKPLILALATSTSSCMKGAVLTVTGGATPYYYSKNGTTFQTTNSLCNLPLGATTLFVRDANKCTKSINVTITNNGAKNRSLQTEFEAKKSGLVADLQWFTESEFEDVEYIIERSGQNNSNFLPIKSILPFGKSTDIVPYFAVDENPLEGENYYRLKQILNDGTEKISEVRKLIFPKFSQKMLLYPNPTDDFLNISLRGIKGVSGNFSIYDSQGRLIQTWEEAEVKNSYQLDLNDFQSGMYKLVLITEKQELIAETFFFQDF